MLFAKTEQTLLLLTANFFSAKVSANENEQENLFLLQPPPQQ
jgi:hypothetical protein